ncbi:uncharacterized protein LOC115016032 [Cottoperca gobio]|uniref:Uncharacterized protein LOC115016032 n=1 Tax=Cottoperca gobio TaxID=56716 RepID=A0A6J2QQE6_COTGO|nr:uncharacterized protein LOC115016032 [Cottoperca gobio]
MALEEEKERKSNERTVKVLDLPNWMFQNLVQLSYRKVPERETYSKLKQNERFPLLGSRFLVMHSKSDRNTKHVEMGFLCLLCQRTLSGEECHAHVFSREHVARFLDRFHPGSLTSSTDAETLMDLAKQAGRVHTISHIQVIKLDMPIWEPYSYSTAITILTSAKWRVGKAELEPTIIPKQKLVPRETLKDVNKNHVRDNSQKNVRVMEGCENTTSQKTTDTSETSPKRISEEVGAKVTDTRCLQKGDEKETPTPSEKGLEKRGEVSSRSSEEMKKAVSETCQAIKMKKMDEPAASEMPQSCKNTDKEAGTPIGKEKSKSVKDVLNQKRIISCPVEDVKQEISHKMEPLASREDAAREESQNLPSSGQKQGTPTDEGESGKPIHETEKGKDLLWQYLKRKTREPVVGLSALLECQCDERDPVYLCECCSLKIPEKDVISHVTGVEHQKIYLGGLKKLPPLPLMHQEKMIGYFAAMFEQENGYGEAQVVDLDDEMYNSLSKQSFKSAIQTVKVLQDQQDGGPGLPSTSALSGVQPVDTSVGLHAQPELCSVEDDYEVVEMEIDDDHEESEAQPHSETTAAYVMTETTCKTTGAPPESNEGVKMTQIKVESADNTHTCRTVSRSSEVKAEIIINTSVAPVKTASTSRAAISSTVAKVTATTSCKAATVANKESTVVREAACRTAPASKTKNTSKPEAAANMTKMSVKWDKTEVSVTVTQLKNSVGSTVGVAPNVQKSKAPAAPNPNPNPTTTKNPPTEPSHNFTSTKRPSENPPAVAVKRLKAIVRPRDVRVSSPSTTDSTEVLRPQVTFASPASSPADGMYVPHNEELSPDNQSEQENEHGLQTLLTSILDAGVAVKMGKPQSYAIPLATGSEGRFAQTPGTCRDAPEKRRPQEGRDPELQDKQDKGSRETAPVKLFNPDPLSSDATGNRERQNQPRFSLKPERVSSHSQAVAIISIGESSHLSRYLRVTGLDREPIIGLGFVWECRGMSESPFFLCESCMEMISHNDICEHMMRSAHKLKYIQMLHHDFLFFWRFEFLLKEMKQYIVEGIVGRLSKCERHNKVDAQCILLRPGLFEYVRSLPFSEALKMVKDIKKEPKLPWPTTCTPEQQGAGKKKEKYNSEKTVGDLDGVKPRRVLSPVDVASGSSNADAVVSPDSSAGTCLSPQKQPETRPPDSQHQRPVPELQVKKEEVHSEYPSSCIFGPTTSQTPSVSPRDECSPTKKRPAAESIETQVRSGTNDPQLEDHLPAIYKPTYSKLRPISQPSPESAYEPTSVDPSATSTLLSPEDKDAGPGSDISTVDRRKLACLIALVRKRKSELNIYHCTSAPDNGDTATSCAYYTSKSGVERTWDPKSVQTTYNMVNVTHNPPSTNSFKEMFSTAAAPVVLGHENQLVSPNSISANFANKSSLEGSTSTRGNFWFGATEAKTVGSIFPSASTGDSSGAQHQRSVEAQSNFGNANQPSPIFCAVTNDNPQPRDNTQTDSTGVPINTIVTARPNHANHQFVDGYNVQEHAEGNQGIQVTHPAFIHNPTAANIEVLFKASAN